MTDFLQAGGCYFRAFPSASGGLNLLIKPVLALHPRGLTAEPAKDIEEIDPVAGREHGRLLENDGLHGHRRPQVGWLQLLLDAVKAIGHDADNIEGTAVDTNGLSQDGRIGGKPLLPEMMTDDDDSSAAGSGIVERGDGAAHEGLSTEHTKVVAGDEIGRGQNGGGINVAVGAGQANAYFI